jgi:hypothetical protein
MATVTVLTSARGAAQQSERASVVRSLDAMEPEMLTVSLEKVCYVIAKARELDVKVAPEELDDDGMGRILEDYADDPTLEELRSFLRAQSDDELKELLALVWIGRGDYGADEWQEVLNQVQDVREKHTVDYLIGTPLLADYLEEGLSQFGHSCEDYEIGRM